MRYSPARTATPTPPTKRISTPTVYKSAATNPSAPTTSPNTMTRATARTLLLRAQALQKLDRVDDALASVSDANLVYLQSVKRDYPDGWELKGKILWAAGRFDEAKAAYEHFLELDPTGAAAAEARRRVNEPR